jgi:hypothetical protein
MALLSEDGFLFCCLCAACSRLFWMVGRPSQGDAMSDVAYNIPWQFHTSIPESSNFFLQTAYVTPRKSGVTNYSDENQYSPAQTIAEHPQFPGNAALTAAIICSFKCCLAAKKD